MFLTPLAARLCRTVLLGALLALPLSAAPTDGTVGAFTTPRNGDEALGPSFNLTLRGGCVSAGVGLRGLGTGDIVVAGIPSGATVARAFLYWNTIGSSNTFTSPTLNGQPVAGSLIGTSADSCWGAFSNFAYRADVTALVTDNGSYTIAGLPSTDPTVDDSQGASLVVIYSAATSPTRTIVINDGAVTTIASGYSHSLTGFTPDAPLTSAEVTYLVGDGQTGGPDGDLLFNGSVIASDAFGGADGLYWDTLTLDITSLSPTDPSTTSMFVPGDCLVWVATVLCITSPSGPSTLEVPALDPFGLALLGLLLALAATYLLRRRVVRAGGA